jgi:hypothetical protein
MPKYDDVPADDQLTGSRRRTVTAAAPPAEPVEPWVDITTKIPVSVRREMKVACAVHGVLLKDAVTEALRAWLVDHPASTM